MQVGRVAGCISMVRVTASSGGMPTTRSGSNRCHPIQVNLGRRTIRRRSYAKREIGRYSETGGRRMSPPWKKWKSERRALRSFRIFGTLFKRLPQLP
jgi:hypothetical protein